MFVSKIQDRSRRIQRPTPNNKSLRMCLSAHSLGTSLDQHGREPISLNIGEGILTEIQSVARDPMLDISREGVDI